MRPPMALKIEGVNVRNTEGEIFAGFTRAYADISLSGALKRRISLSRIRLDSLFVVVNHTPSGAITIENLPQIEPDTIEVQGMTLPFDISVVEIMKGRIEAIEGGERQTLVENVYICVSDISKTTNGISAYVEQIGMYDAKNDRKASASFTFEQRGDTLGIGNLNAFYGTSHARLDTVSAIFGDDEIPDFNVSVDEILLTENDLKLIDNKLFDGTQFTFSGEFEGSSRLLSGRDVNLRNNRATKLNADFTISNYRNPQKAFYDIRLSRAETTLTDLAVMTGVEIEDNRKLRSVGVISLRGTASGPIDEVTVDAQLMSGVGNIDAQIVVSHDTLGSVGLRGKVASPNLVFSDVTDGLVGSTDFDADVDVCIDNQELTYADIEAFGTKIEYLNFAFSIGLTHYRIAHMIFVAALEFFVPNGHIVAAAGVDLSREKNRVYTMLLVDSLRTSTTHLTPQFTDACLTAHVRTKFDASTPDDAKGFLEIHDFSFSDTSRVAAFDSLRLEVSPLEDGVRTIKLASDIGNSTAQGNFLYIDVYAEIMDRLSHSAHNVFDAPERTAPAKTKAQLEAEFYDVQRFTQFLVPELSLPDKIALRASVDVAEHNSSLEFKLDDVQYSSFDVKQIDGRLQVRGDSLGLRINYGEAILPMVGSVGSGFAKVLVANDSLTFACRWNDEKAGEHSGDFVAKTAFTKHDGNLRISTEIDSTSYFVNGEEWKIHYARVCIENQSITVDSFAISSGKKLIGLNGRSSKAEPGDSLCVTVKNLQLERIIEETPDSKFALAGYASIDLKFKDLFHNATAVCTGQIEDFYVDHDRLDRLELSADWAAERQSVLFDLDVISDSIPRTHGAGHFDMATNDFDLLFDIDSVSIGFLNYYLSGAVRDIVGTGSGQLRLYGILPDIKISADLCVNRTDFVIKETHVQYTFTGGDSLLIRPETIDFKNIKFVDKYGKEGIFYGNLTHDMFTGFGLHILFRMKEQLVFDVPIVSSPTDYWSIIGDGLLKITGTTTNTHLDISAATCPNSTFFILPLEKSDINEKSYIKFVSKNDEEQTSVDLEDMLSSVTAHLALDIRPEAQICIVVDKQTGNQMTVNGSGNLVLDVDRSGDFHMSGTYTIANGVYVFAFENVINKRFQINEGSTITWDGSDPYNAILDVSATYKVRAALSDLMGSSSEISADLKRRVPVNCNLFLTNRLSKPGIKFKIEIPSSQNFSQYAFDQYVSTEEEMNRQAFSLLLTNRFYAVQDNSSNGTSYATTTATEMLSNQLSSVISQNKYNVNVGVSYRPGDEVTNEEYEMSMSTQLFNNKMILVGSMGYGRDVSESGDGGGSFLGDFDVEYKLTKSGKLRAKAYTHSNNDVIYETSPTTQGVGLLYRDEFDTVGDLIRKYWYIISGRRRRDRKLAKQQADIQTDESQYEEEFDSNQE